MKKLILTFLILTPAPLIAQESYTINASAANVSTLTDIIIFTNVALCQEVLNVNSCTQAQICVARNVPGGASCTPAQARTANARIWDNTLTGREEFVRFQIAFPRFQDLAGGLPALKASVVRRASEMSTQANKDNACSDLALPANCFP